MPTARHAVVLIGAAVMFASMVPMPASAAPTLVEPRPGMIITKDTTFKPGTYDFSAGSGIVIAADDVTVDGNGAVLEGPGQAGKPDSFVGTGLSADNVSRVTVTGLTVSGFETAMHVRTGSGWTIRHNDLSGNYTDPDFGWGDGKLAGALLLEHVRDSSIVDNVAHENWNGLALHHSDGNVVRHNDFSHCSNVCLKMWSASRNLIEDNNFSWGIRIAPGETHARDSTSALIETASNDNRILRNDFTYGGDGVFLRPLNGVVSTGNYFEGNDASWAHNNAWESWSPGNTYVRNKGNHASYGFWLGNSDDTVLIGNEAAFNGRDNKNAPEAFGNAGIAVVNGSSSHFVLDGNDVHDNTSVGVAIGYLADYPAYHWVLQRNRIHDNTTYGIYLRDSRWITLGGNDIAGNGSGQMRKDAHVSGVFELAGQPSAHAPKATATMRPKVVRAGDPVTFDGTGSRAADGGNLNYRWEFGDGDVATTARATHRFLDPGFYRVGLTVDDGALAGLDHLDVYVLGAGQETGTEPADAGAWSASVDSAQTGAPVHVDTDRSRSLLGGSSVRLSSDDAHKVAWRYQPRRALDASHADQLEFWLSFEQETQDGFDGNQPVVRLVQDADNYIEYTPAKNYLSPWSLPAYEARAGWQRIDVPLAGGTSWTRMVTGSPSLDDVRAIELRTTATGGPYRIWLDALSLSTTAGTPDVAPDIARNPSATGNPAPSASTGSVASWWAALNGRTDGAVWSTAGSGHAEDTFDVDFGVARTLDAIHLDLAGGTGLAAPAKVGVEYWSGGAWRPVDSPRQTPGEPALGHNVVAFDPVTTTKVRLVVTNPAGDSGVGLAELSAVSIGNLAGNGAGAAAPFGTPVPSASAGDGDVWSLVDGSVRDGSGWRSTADDAWVGVDLLRARAVNTVTVYAGDAAPAGMKVQAWSGSDWLDVGNLSARPTAPAPGGNTLSFDTVKTRKLRVLLDPGSGGAEIDEIEVRNTNLLSDASGLGLTVTPTASYTYPGDTVLGPLDGSYADSPRWTSWNSMNAVDWYSLRFDRPVVASRIALYFYDDHGGVQPPKDYTIEYWDGSAWKAVTETGRTPTDPAAGLNTVDFESVSAAGFRLVGTNQNPVNFGVYIGLTELELFSPAGG